LEDPGKDDFELWSPSEEREERCLFGRQTLYHRRVRDRNCYVGDQPKAVEKVVKNCVCTENDFECEFNHERDASGECLLVSGLQSLGNDDSCKGDDDYWYERTPYRKIPHSSCDGGIRLDRGSPHICPGFRAHSTFFWIMVFLLPFGFTSLIGYWYYRRSGMARGTIRLPGDNSYGYGEGSGVLATLASVPWFLIGVLGVAWEHASSLLGSAAAGYRTRRGYRDVPVDEDAQILHFEDEEE